MNFLRNVSLTGVSFSSIQGDPRQMYGVEMFKNYANVQTPPEMKKYLPDIACSIFRYIASKANQNKHRAVHFNMLVAENGSNPELQILTTMIANLIFIKIKEGVFNDMGAAVNSCVPWVVDRRINFIAVNEPNLYNELQQYSNELRSYATEYVAEADNVYAFMSNTYMGGTVSASFGQPQQQASFGAPLTGFGATAQSTGITGFGNNNVITGFGGMSSANTGISSVITRVDSSGQAIKAPSERFNNDMVGLQEFANSSPNKEVQAPAQQQAPVPTAQKQFKASDYYNEDGTPNIATLPITDLPWISSYIQINPVAYNKNIFRSHKKLLPSKDGKKQYVIFSLEENVDRTKHALTTSQQFFGEIINQTGSAVIKDRDSYINRELKKAAEKIEDVKSIDQENEYITSLARMRENSHIVMSTPVSSIEEAIAYGRLAALRFKTEEFGVYNVEFKLEKKFAINRKDAKQLRSVVKGMTYPGLINRLRTVIEDQETSFSARASAVQLNAYIANKFIDFIRFYLSIDEFNKIDSFIDDFNELIDIIAQEYGDIYKQILIENQERFISQHLNFGELYEQEFDVQNLVAGDEEIEQDNTFIFETIVSPCIIAVTEFLDIELALGVPENVGAVFTPKTITKELYELMSTLVSKDKSIGLNSKITAFYFVTADDRVYEVNKGLGEKAPYLIRKVK